MDAKGAHEPLQMVDRILARVEDRRAFRPWPWFLVFIGIAAALEDAGAQLDVAGHGPAVALAGTVLLVVCWAYLIWMSFTVAPRAERLSLAQSRMGGAIRAVWSALDRDDVASCG